jgi:glycosyltransferase involved in cell wall biosynthesis
MNGKFNIGAALIVKNNESMISQVLDSIIPICSQIVVVDTGSFDLTPQICARRGAEVYFKKWNGNFSDSRNYALSQIRTKWALSIDSDEILDVESLTRYDYLFSDPSIGGIKVLIDNYLDREDLTNKSSHKYTRIFRNDSRFQYKGRIHEQIADSIIDTGLRIVESNIKIEHYGYMNIDESKIRRNKELLEAELSSSPNDPWNLYHLASTEFAGKNFEEAEKHFLQIIDSPYLSEEQNELGRLRLSQISLKLEKYQEIEKWTNFESADINREGFRKYIQGASLLLQRKFSESYNILQSKEVQESNLVNKEYLKKTFIVLGLGLQTSDVN